jgi:hypothetical protein
LHVPDHAIDAAFDDAGQQIVPAFDLVLHRAKENGVALTPDDEQAIRDRLAWDRCQWRVGLVRDQGGRFLILENETGYDGYFFQAGEFWTVLIPKHRQHD